MDCTPPAIHPPGGLNPSDTAPPTHDTQPLRYVSCSPSPSVGFNREAAAAMLAGEGNDPSEGAFSVEPGTILKLLCIPALVVLNGLFVAAEFALVAVRKTRVEELARLGRRGAKSAE